VNIKWETLNAVIRTVCGNYVHGLGMTCSFVCSERLLVVESDHILFSEILLVLGLRMHESVPPFILMVWCLIKYWDNCQMCNYFCSLL